MGSRRRAREIALQILFSTDGEADSGARAIDRFFSHFAGGDEDSGDDGPARRGAGGPHSIDDDERTFAAELVLGVAARLAEIDAVIQGASRNWRLERMARVDRNLLRLAVYELRFTTGVPVKAAINEAIEIAKRFGTAESPAFVNGILDRCIPDKPGA